MPYSNGFDHVKVAEIEIAPLFDGCGLMGSHYKVRAMNQTIGFLHNHAAYGILAQAENSQSPEIIHNSSTPSKFTRSFGCYEDLFLETFTEIFGEHGRSFFETVKQTRITGYRIGSNAKRLSAIPAIHVEKAIAHALRLTGHDAERYVASNMVNEDIFTQLLKNEKRSMN
ncbi:MAG: hypothetical protein JW754_04805 [Candidatus Aenigmarchaeota archaeon]|nr:hypothetical protein [Candidatus Aenigmarchaeota archaeon]